MQSPQLKSIPVFAMPHWVSSARCRICLLTPRAVAKSSSSKSASQIANPRQHHPYKAPAMRLHTRTSAVRAVTRFAIAAIGSICAAVLTQVI